MTMRKLKWTRSEDRYGNVLWTAPGFSITRRDRSWHGGAFYVLEGSGVEAWMRHSDRLSDAKDSAEMVVNPEWAPA